MARTNPKRSDSRPLEDERLAKASEKVLEYVRARAIGGQPVMVRKIIQSKLLASKADKRKTAPAIVYQTVIQSLMDTKQLKWVDEKRLSVLPVQPAPGDESDVIADMLAEDAEEPDADREVLKKLGKRHFERRSFIAWAVAVHRRDAENGLTVQANATLGSLKRMLATTEAFVGKDISADDDAKALLTTHALGEKADLEAAIATCQAHTASLTPVISLKPTAPEMDKVLPREGDHFPQQKHNTLYSGLGHDLRQSEIEKQEREEEGREAKTAHKGTRVKARWTK